PVRLPEASSRSADAPVRAPPVVQSHRGAARAGRIARGCGGDAVRIDGEGTARAAPACRTGATVAADAAPVAVPTTDAAGVAVRAADAAPPAWLVEVQALL